MYTLIPRLHVTESRIYIITLNKFIYAINYDFLYPLIPCYRIKGLSKRKKK